MGSGQTKGKAEGAGSSRGSSKVLSFSDRQKNKSVVPLSRSMLLLGTAGVGKTTIVKQLTMHMGSGLSEEKKLILRHALRFACIKRVVDIVNFAAESQDEGEDTAEPTGDPAEDDWLFEKVEELGMINLETAAPEAVVAAGDDVAKMWASALVQRHVSALITNDNDTQLLHACADKFLPRAKSVFAEDFALTDEEALQVRSPTTAVEITIIQHNHENWSVKDVGGQVHHRHSWKTAFSGVSVVLYIVSLADYDKFAGADMKRNLLMESRKLFKDVCKNEALIGRPFVLLFNKRDLFEQKLKNKPFNVCPQFHKSRERDPSESDAEYADRCCNYLFRYYEKAYSDILTEAKQEERGGKKVDRVEAPLEYYATCATDANFVEESFATVFKSIMKLLDGAIADSGF